MNAYHISHHFVTVVIVVAFGAVVQNFHQRLFVHLQGLVERRHWPNCQANPERVPDKVLALLICGIPAAHAPEQFVCVNLRGCLYHL